MAGRPKKATMGRPRLDEDLQKNIQVNLRFTADEKYALDEAAEADERSVSAWIRKLVLTELKKKKLL